jgi:periodic tryptophan protein 1
MSMITASLWVPRGAPAAFPVKYEVDEGELARISKLAKLQLEDAKSDLDRAKNGENDVTSADASSEENERRVQLPQSQGYVMSPKFQSGVNLP